MFPDLPKFAFFTGNGGVGKTTIAAAVAVELAARGHEVLLTATDPVGPARLRALRAAPAPIPA